MYKLLRDSHLVLGLFFSTFLLMFGISSLRFAHPDWISPVPSEEQTLTLTVEKVSGARSLARSLMEEHGLRGNFRVLRETEKGFQFEIGRLGTTYEVSYIKHLNKVEIRTLRRPFIGILLGMHFTFGFEHDNWLYNVFGALNLGVSIALLLLGGSGVYLWFKIHKERLTGSIILLSSLLTLFALIVSIRVA